MNTSYLSKENTKCMKGIFAVCVFLHHLYQYSGYLQGTLLRGVFQVMGYLSIGMFFFFTGYGLMLQFQDIDYVRSFFKRRFLPLYVFYAVLVIIYALWRAFLLGAFPINAFLKSFLFAETIVKAGWYLQVTFIAYLMVYVAFFVGRNNKCRIILVAAFVVLYCMMCNRFGISTTRYESILCVPLGMAWYECKDRIDGFLKKKSSVFLLISGILFILFLSASYFARPGLVCKMVSAAFFAATVLSGAYILPERIINNRITETLGRYSLGIYTAQGLFLLLRDEGTVYIENGILFIAVSVIGTGCMAILFCKLYNHIRLCAAYL